MTHSAVKDFELIFLSGILGPILIYKGFQSLKLKKLADGLAASNARSVAMGAVELEGHAQSLGNLIDPIYKKPCACYKIVIKDYRSSGKSGHWVTIHEEASSQPFSLLDSTGSVIVLPLKVNWEEQLTLNTQAGLYETGRCDAQSLDYLQKFTNSNNSSKLEANILRDGDPLFVIGYAQPIDIEQPQHATITLQEAARLLKTDKNRMMKLDVNKDGRIDDNEWETGLNQFMEELNNRSQGGEKIPGIIKNIGITPGPTMPLVFGTSRKELIKKNEALFFWQVIGGVGLILLATFLILNKIYNLF